MNRVYALNRNILLYRLLLVLGANGLMTSVIYFFFTSAKGLSPAQALFLIGFGALAKAVSEVPTGVVADKFSRKYSILIGYVIALFCSIGIFLASGFSLILLLIILGGIGASFISGADDALLYDTLKELKKPEKFKSVSSMSESVEYVAFAITILIGALLGSISLYLPLFVNILLMGLSVLISYLMVEPAMTSKGENIEQIGYLLHTRTSLKTIFSKAGLQNGLLGSFLSLALILAVFKSTKNILAPILSEYGLTISTIGLITSLVILIKAGGAFIASKISKHGNEVKEVILSLVLCILGLLAITITHVPLIKLAVFIFIISLDNVVLINLKTIVNDRIESSQRSTILSLLSLFARSTEMLFLTSFGSIVEGSLNLALLFTVVWLVLAAIILVTSYKKILSKQ